MTCELCGMRVSGEKVRMLNGQPVSITIPCGCVVKLESSRDLAAGLVSEAVAIVNAAGGATREEIANAIAADEAMRASMLANAPVSDETRRLTANATPSEQHSPGPWRTRSVGKAIDVVAADGRYVATLASRPESATDARVIAAAPRMLSLLRVVDAEWLDDVSVQDEVRDLMEEIDGGRTSDVRSKLVRLAEAAHEMLGLLREVASLEVDSDDVRAARKLVARIDGRG
jgi:hypothetical protein